MKNYILTGVLFILMQVLTFVRRFLLENCESISIAHLVFKKKKKLKHAAYIVIAVVIVYFFISYCRHILGWKSYEKKERIAKTIAPITVIVSIILGALWCAQIIPATIIIPLWGVSFIVCIVAEGFEVYYKKSKKSTISFCFRLGFIIFLAVFAAIAYKFWSVFFSIKNRNHHFARCWL